MRRFVFLLIFAALGWYGYTKYQARIPRPLPTAGETLQAPLRRAPLPPVPREQATSPYHCDGRTHCSQMTSCAEANFFLNNCPGTKMDGNNDGIPCEKQWCK